MRKLLISTTILTGLALGTPLAAEDNARTCYVMGKAVETTLNATCPRDLYFVLDNLEIEREVEVTDPETGETKIEVQVDRFDVFLGLVKRAGFANWLKGETQTSAAATSDSPTADGARRVLTLFAPPDRTISKELLTELLDPDNEVRLKLFVTSHMLDEARGPSMNINKFPDRQHTVYHPDSAVLDINWLHTRTVNNAKMTKMNIFASNGVIHPIDQPIKPF